MQLTVQRQHSELEPAEWNSWWFRSPGAPPPRWRLIHPLGWGSSRSEQACWSLGPYRPPNYRSPLDPQEGMWLWWSVWNRDNNRKQEWSFTFSIIFCFIIITNLSSYVVKDTEKLKTISFSFYEQISHKENPKEKISFEFSLCESSCRATLYTCK